MVVILIEPTHLAFKVIQSWKITVFSETSSAQELVCYGSSANGVVASVRRRFGPHALVIVADITDCDIDNASRGIFREPEYSAFEAAMRAHDARRSR